MVIEEFLVKLGFNAEGAAKFSSAVDKITTGANKINDVGNNISNSMSKAANDTGKSFNSTSSKVNETKSKLSGLKVAAIAAFAGIVMLGNRLASAFNGAIDNAKNLFYQRNALFKVTGKEIQQAAQYKRSMAATGLAIDSIKTKIALNLAPAITNISNGFRSWLTVNKDLITNGITKVIQVLGKVVQVIVNTIKFIDKIVSATIGWKAALVVLGAAWAVFNRALLFSPIGIVIGLITVLMLLIDDLMVYMKGGKSLFGKYWDPLINGAKVVVKTIKSAWNLIKAIWEGDTESIKKYGKELFDSYIQYLKNLFSGIKSILSTVLKSVLIFFGMSESDAAKTVDRIGKIFNFIIDLLIKPFKDAYNVITAIMDYLGIDAGDVVNFIVQTFYLIGQAIVAPFKWAWELVSSLFDIWEDDTSSLVDKIGKTLFAVSDFITKPFVAGWNFVKSLFTSWVGDGKSFTDNFGKIFSNIKESITKPFEQAIAWIKDKFFGFIDTVKNKVNGVLSFIGLGGEEDKSDPFESINKLNSANFALSPQSAISNNTSKVLNQGDINTNVTIHSNETKDGVNQMVNGLQQQLDNMNNNGRSAMGL